MHTSLMHTFFKLHSTEQEIFIYLRNTLLLSLVCYVNISQTLMNLFSEHPFDSFNCKLFYKWEAEAQS